MRRIPPLRVVGRSELLPAPIREKAMQELDFPIQFELVDGIEGLQRVVTRPESFDVYLQWHTIDLIWTARSIQPIEMARLNISAEIIAATQSQAGASKVIDTVFDKLFMQPDGQLGRNATQWLSMLPMVHGVDSFGYLEKIQEALAPGEVASWGWLLDPRWAGQVALVGDPVLGIIEGAMAVEAARGRSFADVGNLSVSEVDEVVDTLIHKKKIGHFKGVWLQADDAVRLVQRGGVKMQTIFSPAAATLRGLGVPIVISTPAEGCRGWHSDLCLSAATTGDTLDAAYDFLNWCQNGWAGACFARQGYYATFPDRIRAHLSRDEWDYWYGGIRAARALPDPEGKICVPKDHRREGGSHRERMSRARVWNTFMDEHTHVVRRWREFLEA